MIAVIDYGVGNLFSLSSSLAYLGLENKITRSARELDEASHIILPGVGAFGDAMEKLASTALCPSLSGRRKTASRCWESALACSFCLKKAMSTASTRALACCRAASARWNRTSRRRALVTRCRTSAGTALHLVRPENPLMANTREGDFVYFVHSFYAKGCGDALVAGAEYGVTVPGAVARGNVYGCQFHPEKSGEAGLRILRAFAAL